MAPRTIPKQPRRRRATVGHISVPELPWQRKKPLDRVARIDTSTPYTDPIHVEYEYDQRERGDCHDQFDCV